ncbi:aminoacyl-tRNA hydrolase [Actinopolymorpha pittospori]|uniref:Peptidyl-tRNA hydrolase n=1 Tax=Actinopolymorpha pittospori TaxID=648752 RepID=A0A927REB5_9ACTN|nr:aminoacyl-tRNA hydrolase [Actinopolymorpha pittospori]MBE1611974.1 PTH1 family peptidyl-tRNA hydrolase [Actinopolymorpha pittospori]
MADSPWLVVGLGNPGPTYAAHRHNIGHQVVDLLAERMGGRLRPHPRGRAEVLEGRLGGLPGVRAVLATPRSYMNESGGSVASLATFYKVEPDQIVVVHDELDIPFAALRLKMGGGDNGHNGLRSIRRSLGTGDFLRVRCGIGRPPGRQDPADFVLSPFGSTERKELPFFLDRAADAVESLVTAGLEQSQNSYHV